MNHQTTNAFRLSLILALCTLLHSAVQGEPAPPAAAVQRQDAEQVGRTDDGRAITPVNQILTPYGKQIDLPGMRPQALALSPDGRRLAVSGKTDEVVLFDAASGDLIERTPFPSVSAALAASSPVSSQIIDPDDKSQLSFTGLRFSPSGDRLYLSNVEGRIEVFKRSSEGKFLAETFWTLPPADAPRRAAEIPAGLAVSDDGKRLYLCGNLSNRLVELDTSTGKLARSFDVGVAPYDVLLKGGKAYVSNWGGRRPEAGDLVGPAGRGSTVRVDPKRHIASEGSVSVVDLKSGKTIKEIITDKHASGLAASAGHPWVICCNAAADNLSVIDARSDELVATIWTKPNAADLLGASPNAAAFNENGSRLFVANGSQNAIAVIDFDAKEPAESRLAGLIPVGWYPGAIAFDKNHRQLVVANIKGLPKDPKVHGDSKAPAFNSHQFVGSLTLAPLPKAAELAKLSERAAANLRAPRIAASRLPPRPGQPPRPIPERIGEPSPIKHVVYIIKENRTYDQVFGDIKKGNGDERLCVFGKRFTPNQHKIADEFVLLDNAYCCGILSADGHQWSNTAFSTDYMEKSFAGFPRSYPDGMGDDEEDALVYAPSGFLWDNAREHGKSVRNYGEFMAPLVHWKDPKRKGRPGFTACYRAWKTGDDGVVFSSRVSVEHMKEFSPTDFVGWDLSVPDQWRADYFINEIERFERDGKFPNLVVICLPQDHTGGTNPGFPTPGACVSDNDLAFGRIVEALSRSKFWPSLAIFAIEDDPQAGWDHMSGYRTTAFAISPYVKRGAVVGTQYNTTSLIRTMEQILGLPPMNQFDASALPMFDCFTNEPDLRPYAAAPVETPLDEMNPRLAEISDPRQREDAVASAALDLSEADRAPEDALNRILWRAMKGASAAYPEWAVTALMEDDED
jgi:DNA-binding beta-propeller fold protein YncE